MPNLGWATSLISIHEYFRIRSWQREVDGELEKMFKSTSNVDILERGYKRFQNFWQESNGDIFIPKEVVQEVKTISSKIFEESLEALKVRLYLTNN